HDRLAGGQEIQAAVDCRQPPIDPAIVHRRVVRLLIEPGRERSEERTAGIVSRDLLDSDIAVVVNGVNIRELQLAVFLDNRRRTELADLLRQWRIRLAPTENRTIVGTVQLDLYHLVVEAAVPVGNLDRVVDDGFPAVRQEIERLIAGVEG